MKRKGSSYITRVEAATTLFPPTLVIIPAHNGFALQLAVPTRAYSMRWMREAGFLTKGEREQ